MGSYSWVFFEVRTYMSASASSLTPFLPHMNLFSRPESKKKVNSFSCTHLAVRFEVSIRLIHISHISPITCPNLYQSPSPFSSYIRQSLSFKTKRKLSLLLASFPNFLQSWVEACIWVPDIFPRRTALIPPGAVSTRLKGNISVCYFISLLNSIELALHPSPAAFLISHLFCCSICRKSPLPSPRHVLDPTSSFPRG